MYLQSPIDDGTRLLVQTRVSTEEQRRQSGDDQKEYCLAFIGEKSGAKLKSVEHIHEEAVSGELRSRPGIDLVRQRIREGAVDLIIVEDSSRLFRGIGACEDFVSFAVDHDVRVICINDGVDTAQDDWKQRLADAQRHHGQDNFFTRHRINRAHDGLWKPGAAIGPLMAGYRRTIRNPEMKRPPKFDEIILCWVAIFIAAFQSVARGEPLWKVAEFLTASKLPKSSGAQFPDWTARNVIALIRNPIYRGFQCFRVTITKPRHMTGKSRQIDNPDSAKILEREMPHLRMVEDWLWHAANKAIDDRRREIEFVRGKNHSLAGIPRDSRSPLSNIFICSICGAKMHMEGRNEGGYRCSGARRGRCWNKVTALRDFTHLQIGSMVSQAILDEMQNVTDPLLEYLETVFRHDENFEQQEQDFSRRRNDLKRRQQRLLRLVQDEDEPPDFVMQQVRTLRQEEAALAHQEQELAQRRSRKIRVPGRDELQGLLQEAAQTLSLCRRDSGPLLQQLLVGPIRAIPCQQFGSSKIVMRAEFTLQLVQFLPDEFRLMLRNRDSLPEHLQVLQRKFVVDLFEPSTVPRLAMQALKEFENFPEDHRPTMDELGKILKTDRTRANRALRLGQRMREAGLTDPFVPLTEKPDNAGRWRYRKTG